MLQEPQKNATNFQNYKQFLREYNISFQSEAKAVAWLKQLNPRILVRIGKTYFVQEAEMAQLLKEYLNKKKLQRDRQRSNAMKNFANNKPKKIPSRITKVSKDNN